MNLLIEISPFSKIIPIPFFFFCLLFLALCLTTALSNDAIKKVHQLCFGGRLMSMIKDIFTPPPKKKMLSYICIFHVLGLVNSQLHCCGQHFCMCHT